MESSVTVFAEVAVTLVPHPNEQRCVLSDWDVHEFDSLEHKKKYEGQSPRGKTFPGPECLRVTNIWCTRFWKESPEHRKITSNGWRKSSKRSIKPKDDTCCQCNKDRAVWRMTDCMIVLIYYLFTLLIIYFGIYDLNDTLTGWVRVRVNVLAHVTTTIKILYFILGTLTSPVWMKEPCWL